MGCLCQNACFLQVLEGLTEVFGRMSAGISGPKLPLWADFSFLKVCLHSLNLFLKRALKDSLGCFLYNRGRKRHINFEHINSFCRPSSPECPWDKLGLSQGQTGLPLCKVRRKPGFVPGTNPLCPGDKPGLSAGHSRGQTRATGPKSLCLCAFFLPDTRPGLKTQSIVKYYAVVCLLRPRLLLHLLNPFWKDRKLVNPGKWNP